MGSKERLFFCFGFGLGFWYFFLFFCYFLGFGLGFWYLGDFSVFAYVFISLDRCDRAVGSKGRQ